MSSDRRAKDARARLRLVRPEDKALLADGFALLSERSRYQRFLAAKRRLSERELAYLTEVDNVRDTSVQARLLGERSFGENRAEVAQTWRTPWTPAWRETAGRFGLL